MRLGEYPHVVSPSDGGYALDTSPSEGDGVAEAFVAPNLGDEAKVLQSLGFSKPLIRLLAVKARDNGTTVETELLHHPGIDESAHYGAMRGCCDCRSWDGSPATR